MTIALSDALALQQAQVLADALSGGFIRLFSGARPANPTDAETGTLMGVITVGGVAGAGLHYVASSGVITKASEPWVFEALASGTVSWFRVVAAGDDGSEDPAALRIDGDVGTTTSPSDMTWLSQNLTNGVVYTLDSFLYFIQPVG